MNIDLIAKILAYGVGAVAVFLFGLKLYTEVIKPQLNKTKGDKHDMERSNETNDVKT